MSLECFEGDLVLGGTVVAKLHLDLEQTEAGVIGVRVEELQKADGCEEVPGVGELVDRLAEVELGVADEDCAVEGRRAEHDNS